MGIVMYKISVLALFIYEIYSKVGDGGFPAITGLELNNKKNKKIIIISNFLFFIARTNKTHFDMSIINYTK